MEDLAATHFDDIILGTDNTSSILAAALAISGHKVLHLDSQGYYGSIDGTLSFNEFQKFLISPESPPFLNKQIHISPGPDEECNQFPRRFNFDLQPKMIYSVGDVVDYLLACGIAQYIEFKSVKSGMLWTQDGFRQVPCNKSEIFQDEKLNVVEKRKLMKIVEHCTKLLEGEDFDPNQDFKSLLEEKGLPENLQNILFYAILLVDGDTRSITLGEALGKIQKYSSSLGIYKEGSTLLYPMYGAGDISQGFCRVSAVYEGTYVITEELSIFGLLKEDNKIKGIATTLGEFHGNRVLLNSTFANVDESLVAVPQAGITRGVILSRGVFHENDGPVLFSVPPHTFENEFPIYILQLSSNSSTCPEGYSVLHLYTRLSNYDENLHSFQRLIEQFPIEIVFYATYLQQITENSGEAVHIPNPGLGFEVSDHFEAAKKLFREIRGDEPFLPSRPNPEGEEDNF
ncbi:unnamed protein product [Blepharisma stoltei]|uniref:Rab proteins geranylgeranyltransferase component A n=1 Tax=Blepharisma stoltei TaxID=1481888 RepID=A0AAU9IZZ0_9CILI|nr:unnamed protein product [Blepharisma stoltei]